MSDVGPPSVGFLRPGPRWAFERVLRAQEGIEQHFAYMAELAVAGDVVQGGPLHAMDDVLTGDLLALIVFSVPAGRAAELMRSDPTVASGLTGCDVLPWFQSL